MITIINFNHVIKYKILLNVMVIAARFNRSINLYYLFIFIKKPGACLLILMTIKKWFLWTTWLNITSSGKKHHSTYFSSSITILCFSTSFSGLMSSLTFAEPPYKSTIFTKLLLTICIKYQIKNNDVPSDFNNVPWLY